ncbi:DUF1801 domain-containing protein [Flavobacterium sp. WLB]|uniref:YdhG-like domain-containing protein n=1 Tax=Flavobacterium panici TaxID=2654843 RepID=A0A9N8P2F2_9FLAO|nr:MULTISPECIES: DUF1801 domain-containing protein [Flavobacterium]KOP38455.1 hypothetical protein AKO67_09635 [Flavobacterium sp. VMW]OWU88814.1 hypothetical protein APR43_20435 [Flavobacterium sp. NLM]PUU69597.1 DUF1801 domain-containing protein [Flavobacterium sp. WLB]CAC9975032.1 hypothetical protein FLAPXU55_02735 [Flavobacterium panici]
MAKNKTAETQSSVIDFINTVDSEAKRNDAFELVKIMKAITGFEPKMWGPSIIGFGTYHYKYATGHEGDAPLAAFSPRKAATTVYFYLPEEKREELFSNLGKYKVSKACIYIKKLADIDVEILKKIISLSIEEVKNLYPQK